MFLSNYDIVVDMSGHLKCHMRDRLSRKIEHFLQRKQRQILDFHTCTR